MLKITAARRASTPSRTRADEDDVPTPTLHHVRHDRRRQAVRADQVSLCGPHEDRPLQAIVRAVDPNLDVDVVGTAQEWTAEVVWRDEPAKEFDEVAVTRVSTGSSFTFQPRRSLPITPVNRGKMP